MDRRDPFNRLRSAFSQFNEDQLSALVSSIEETFFAMNMEIEGGASGSINDDRNCISVGHRGKKKTSSRSNKLLVKFHP